MRKTLLVLTVSAFALAGCFTEAQREAMRIGSIAKDSWEQEKPCLKVIEASPRYTRLYQKLGVSTADDPFRDPSAVQLADREVISNEDVAMGLEWYAEFQSCELTALEALGRIDPELEIMYADRQADIASLLNDVVSKTIQTYGPVNFQIYLIKQKQRAAVQNWGKNNSTVGRTTSARACRTTRDSKRVDCRCCLHRAGGSDARPGIHRANGASERGITNPRWRMLN